MRAPSNLKIWLFCVALTLGLIATVLINASLKNAVETASGGKLRAVVVAKRLIQAGDRISEKDIHVIRVPEQHVSSRAVYANQKYLLNNKICALATKKGEILTWDAMAQTPLSALSDQLGVMERAVTLRVDEHNSFNNLIKPGDRIDIMRLAQEPRRDGTMGVALSMLMQNVPVIAVDSQISRTLALSPESKDMVNAVRTITVKVSPDEAASLAFAQAEGQITFSLRNPHDVFSAQVPDFSGTKSTLEIASKENEPAIQMTIVQSTPESVVPEAALLTPLHNDWAHSLEPAEAVMQLEVAPPLERVGPVAFEQRLQQFAKIEE